MIEPFLASSGTTYVISAAKPNGYLYDFSTNTFKENPIDQFQIIRTFIENEYYDNILYIDPTSMVSAASSDFFLFVHESGSTISFPISMSQYVDVGLAINSSPFAPTARTDDSDNPSPRSNRRASYLFGGRVINS